MRARICSRIAPATLAGKLATWSWSSVRKNSFAVGALFYALATIWLRRIGPAESHEAIVLHFSLVGLVTMIALAAPAWRWPDWSGGLALLGAGLGGGGAQLAMTRAYSLQRAAPVSAVSNLGVVFTYLLAIPVFGDLPAPWQLGGAVLVIAATALLTAEPAGAGAA